MKHCSGLKRSLNERNLQHSTNGISCELSGTTVARHCWQLTGGIRVGYLHARIVVLIDCQSVHDVGSRYETTISKMGTSRGSKESVVGSPNDLPGVLVERGPVKCYPAWRTRFLLFVNSIHNPAARRCAPMQ